MSNKDSIKKVQPLTAQVAMEYLRRHAWTPEEAVLMLNLLDPNNRAFFKDDGPNPYPMTGVYWESIQRFNPKRKSLKVSDWLKWAREGSDEHPRTIPLSYANEYTEAKANNSPDALKVILGDSRHYLTISAPTAPHARPNVKLQRRDPLTGLISRAQGSSSDRWDTSQVFATLQVWALEKPPRQPLCGVTDGGIQWRTSDDQVRELSLKNLGDRLRRRRKLE